MPITTGTGLISGLDIAGLVDSLMSIESRGRELVATRQAEVDDRRLGVMDVSALMISLKLKLASMRATKKLTAVTATSSNTSVLTATASSGAAVGTHQLTVARLVSTQQYLSAGVSDYSSASLGTGTVTVRPAATRLTDDATLSTLNGQEGVRLGKIRITDRSGVSAVVDLSNAVTIGDVVNAINSSESISVLASVDNGRLVISDQTGLSSSNLTVTEVGLTHTAEDLGIKTSVAANTLTGGNLVSVNADTQLSLLNHGLGVRTGGGNDFSVTLRDGTSFEVDIGTAATLGEVVEAINAASLAHSNPGAVVAAINDDGDGLKLTDSSTGGSLTVTALGGSRTAQDLGLLGSDTAGDGVIQGRALMSDLQSVLLNTLNGGDGVARGRISITDRAGVASTVDLRGADTVQDVIDAINAAGANVTASLNAAGNGLVITDNTGLAGNLTITDLEGTTAAADLGITVDAAVGSVSSGDLERQIVNERTLLSSLKDGKGITRGTFTVTDSAGNSATIDLTQGNETTLQDVLDEINSKPTISVTARINDAGDGLVIEDTAGGAALLTIADVSGSSAADLGISGAAATGETTINSSPTVTIAVEAGDTLSSLVSKINAAGAGLRASIVNDGSSQSPYRLSLVATGSGEYGARTVDLGGLGLSLNEVVRGADAVVRVGDASSTEPLLVTSSSNTLTGVIDRVTLDLTGAAPSQTVTVSISKDTAGISTSVSEIVDMLNGVFDRINSYTAFDAETLEAGVLQGDTSIRSAERKLQSLLTQSFSATGSTLTSLSRLGIKFSGGGKLTFDSAAFERALKSDPDSVEKLFLDTEHGFIAKASSAIDNLTKTTTGSLTIHSEQLLTQSEMYTERMASMDALLELKRARLELSFTNMETALASLQTQQSALTSLNNLLSSLYSNK